MVISQGSAIVIVSGFWKPMFVYTCVCSDFVLIMVMFCLPLLLSLTMLEQGHEPVGGRVALLGDERGLCVLQPAPCSLLLLRGIGVQSQKMK